MNKTTLSILLLSTFNLPLAVAGSENTSGWKKDIATELQLLIITATRQGMAANELTHAVTVIDRQQLNSQLQTSHHLGEVLAKTVSGMAPASQTLTNFNQSLRGRNLQVLIDGISQNINQISASGGVMLKASYQYQW
ncbi:MAG: hypothetical protein COB23_04120 [Methylophaga sp.]|nr:MAG: hypothetical protein COB23_04120 [Methylophaga sp.]